MITFEEYNKFNHNRLFEKLVDIRDNFDDYFDEDDNASPIDNTVFKNTNSILNLCEDSCLSYWSIEPFTNGTILLVSKNNDSVINIGISKYSCNMVINGKTVKKNPVPFNAENISELILQYYIHNTFKVKVLSNKKQIDNNYELVFNYNTSKYNYAI